MAFIDSSSEEMQSPPAVKKPYQKPSFRFEEVFVTSALTCGKVISSDLNCSSHMSAS
jgi:hypothetical protein